MPRYFDDSRLWSGLDKYWNDDMELGRPRKFWWGDGISCRLEYIWIFRSVYWWTYSYRYS